MERFLNLLIYLSLALAFFAKDFSKSAIFLIIAIILQSAILELKLDDIAKRINGESK